MKTKMKTTTYLMALLIAASMPALLLARSGGRQDSGRSSGPQASSRSSGRQEARSTNRQSTQQARPARSTPSPSRSVRTNRTPQSSSVRAAAPSQTYRSNSIARQKRTVTQNRPAATSIRRSETRQARSSSRREPVIRHNAGNANYHRPATTRTRTYYNHRPRVVHHNAPPVRHVYHRNYGWFGHYRNYDYGHRNHCVIRLHGSIGLGLGFYYGAFYPFYRSAYYYDHPWNTVYVYGSSPTVIYETSSPTVIVRQPQPTVIYETSPTVVAKESEPTVTLRESNEQQSDSSQAARYGELASQVLRDQDEKRLEAARLLADYPSIQTTATLTDVLINDADPDVRTAAAQTLAQLNDPLAYEALLRSAQAENEPAAQQAAEQAAQQIQPIAEAKGISITDTFPPMNQGKPELAQLLENLRFAATADRERAAKEMAQHAGTQASAALINTLMNDYDKEVRKSAARSLADTGEHMALPYLNWSQQNDPEPSVREEAKKAVEKIEKAS